MKKLFKINLLLLVCVAFMFGCKKKAKVSTITETVAQRQIRDNIKDLKDRLDESMRYEYLKVAYFKDGEQVTEVLSYKDDPYKILPNIPYTEHGKQEDKDGNIYYIYVHANKTWQEDIMPETKKETEESIEDIYEVEELEEDTQETQESYEEIIEESETEIEETTVEETTELFEETTETKSQNEYESSIKETTKKKKRIINIFDEIEEIEGGR